MVPRLAEGSSTRSDNRLVHGRFAGVGRPSGSMAFSQEPPGFRLQNGNEISVSAKHARLPGPEGSDPGGQIHRSLFREVQLRLILANTASHVWAAAPFSTKNSN
jgi:hypothetical protein